jgi:hypothetical protein
MIFKKSPFESLRAIALFRAQLKGERKMNTISAGTFEKFIGKEIANFLPGGVKAEDVHEIHVCVSIITDLLVNVPRDESYGGSMGETRLLQKFFAVKMDGSVLDSPAPTGYSDSCTAHTQRQEFEGVPLGIAWEEHLSEIRFAVEYYSDLNDWEGGSEYRNVRTLTLHLIRQDEAARVEYLRWLVEQVIKKVDPTSVLRVAAVLDLFEVADCTRCSYCVDVNCPLTSKNIWLFLCKRERLPGGKTHTGYSQAVKGDRAEYPFPYCREVNGDLKCPHFSLKK